MFIILSKFVKVILFSIWLFLLVAGCQPVTNDSVGTVFVTEEARSSLNAVTVTPTRSISQTVTSTATSIPLSTSSPTLQPSPTHLPTETVPSTPWPTLPPDEAENKVLSLLADNQNPHCLLPCWWGATPGQTRWGDIQSHLQSFSLQTYVYSEDSLYVIAFPIPSNINDLEEFHVGYTINELDIITTIGIPRLNIEGYDPPTMMTIYGVPDEVWIKTLDAPREEVLPFQLIVVYQQQGISFHYYTNASTDGDIVTACFEPGFVELEYPDLFPAGPRIYLWEPGQPKTIDEIANIPREIYFPLAEKTDLTPQTLYEKFTNPAEQPCIETSADSWRDY
jgi:hypothetical protein